MRWQFEHSHRVHDIGLEQEALDDLLVAAPAVGGLAQVPGMVGREVCGLPADAPSDQRLVASLP
jgi:hypothetical protein